MSMTCRATRTYAPRYLQRDFAGNRNVFPEVDFSNPEWGMAEEVGFSIEVNIGADDPVMGFALLVRGNRSAVDGVAALSASGRPGGRPSVD
jgi:hypothetical protein